MRDAAYVAIVFGFFGLCAAYVRACARIVGTDDAVEAVERPVEEAVEEAVR